MLCNEWAPRVAACVPLRELRRARARAVQASIAANTFVVSGPSQTRSACPAAQKLKPPSRMRGRGLRKVHHVTFSSPVCLPPVWQAHVGGATPHCSANMPYSLVRSHLAWKFVDAHTLLLIQEYNVNGCA